MRLYVLLAVVCTVAGFAGSAVPGRRNGKIEDWIDDEVKVAEEMASIFGDYDYDEEASRINLEALVGSDDEEENEIEEDEEETQSENSELIDECNCEADNHCHCCARGKVNFRSFTGCVHIGMGPREGLLDVLLTFNGLKVTENVISANRYEESCQEVVTKSEIMTVCTTSRSTPKGICLKTTFKDYESTLELKYKCVRSTDGRLSVAE